MNITGTSLDIEEDTRVCFISIKGKNNKAFQRYLIKRVLYSMSTIPMKFV